MPRFEARQVGDENVVADELDASRRAVGQELPARPVVLGQAVFERDDGVLPDPVILEGDHLARSRSLLSDFLKTYLPSS